MIIYRPHRGTLSEAMKKIKIFNDKKEMFDFIVKEWDGLISIEDLVLSKESFNDNRIGWENCKYIITKRCGNKNYEIPQAIGFCSEKWK